MPSTPLPRPQSPLPATQTRPHERPRHRDSLRQWRNQSPAVQLRHRSPGDDRFAGRARLRTSTQPPATKKQHLAPDLPARWRLREPCGFRDLPGGVQPQGADELYLLFLHCRNPATTVATTDRGREKVRPGRSGHGFTRVPREASRRESASSATRLPKPVTFVPEQHSTLAPIIYFNFIKLLFFSILERLLSTLTE